MKKGLSLLTVMLLVLLLPMKTFAMNNSVTVSTASANATTVTVSGTTAASAVMLQVRDSSGNILGMSSMPVVSGSFSGSADGFALTPGTSYTVYVADYEGGNWTTAAVTVPADATPAPAAGTTVYIGGQAVPVSPKTGESEWPIAFLLGVIALCAGVTAALHFRRKGF